MSDRHDNHYTQLQIEPMHYCLVNGLDPAQSTVIKYVTRHRLKGQSIRDLEAARDLLNDYIDFIKSDEEIWKGETLRAVIKKL